MQFCPTCGNLLAINRLNDAHQMQFSCNTCPYVYPLDSRVLLLVPRETILKDQPCSSHLQVHDKTVLTRKKVDDVLGGEGAWDNVDSTDGTVSVQ